MPVKPRPACPKNGCPNLASKHGLCEQHVKEYNIKRYSEPTLYDARWQKIRQLWLIDHPLCAECEREGRVNTGNIVDHIIPHRGDRALFYDTNNLQTLCKRHHDIKTAKGE